MSDCDGKELWDRYKKALERKRLDDATRALESERRKYTPDELWGGINFGVQYIPMPISVSFQRYPGATVGVEPREEKPIKMSAYSIALAKRLIRPEAEVIERAIAGSTIAREVIELATVARMG